MNDDTYHYRSSADTASKALSLPVRRPTATAMFFCAISLMGLFAWFRLPIELIPNLSGEKLYIQFSRPGSTPEIIEREILLPLHSRISELAGFRRSNGEIYNHKGTLDVTFDSGGNHRVRELEVQRIAANLSRDQPPSAEIEVNAQDFSAISSFAMVIEVVGQGDLDQLRNQVDDLVQPLLAALPGVSQVFTIGGNEREVTIAIDPQRSAEFGIDAVQIEEKLKNSVKNLRSLGAAETHNQRFLVVLDNQSDNLGALGNIQPDPTRPVLLRHLADISIGAAPRKNAFRVNGTPALGLVVFKEEGANLVALGRTLRGKIKQLQEEFHPLGIRFVIGFDAAETVSEQITRLQNLALSGFLVALVVLYLFLREWRAVAIVAISVPVSILSAGAFLYLGGWTLNVITLFGLAISVGLLVDNSIVVYEAVQARLEKHRSPDAAVEEGLRRTLRAILIASLTSAVVFTPAVFLVDNTILARVLNLVAVAIVLPLFSSLLVAVGLVPLLTKQLTRQVASNSNTPVNANAARFTSQQLHNWRTLSSDIVKAALRRPLPYLAGVSLVVVLTVFFALPWVLVSSRTASGNNASQLTLQVEFDNRKSMDAAENVFQHLDKPILGLKDIDIIEVQFQEDGGVISVKFKPNRQRLTDTNAAKVRALVLQAAEYYNDLRVMDGGQSADESHNWLAGKQREVLISGPDMDQLSKLANTIKQELESITEVEQVWISRKRSNDELRVSPQSLPMAFHNLYAQQVLHTVRLTRREGRILQQGFRLENGREIPIAIRSTASNQFKAAEVIADLPLKTREGTLPLRAVSQVEKKTAPTAISHHNGHRELSVQYRLKSYAPSTGPGRVALEQHIQRTLHTIFKPKEYRLNTQVQNNTTKWSTAILLPVILLLFAVLAMAFESLTLPLLILLALPLTILGSVWALLISGNVGIMAIVGVVALLGLTINPAILLVDRMQQRVRRTNCGAGAAALIAVRERTRPVLMTSCTTIAGLWPLSLARGENLEIWPPFATVVMGGLVTSTLLTLLIIPVGFVLLSRLDRLFKRLGPQRLLVWLALNACAAVPIICYEVFDSVWWQLFLCSLIAGTSLRLMAGFYRDKHAVPDGGYSGFSGDTESDALTHPITVEVRYLSKIYAQVSPLTKFLTATRLNKLAPINTDKCAITHTTITYSLMAIASFYLESQMQNVIWQIVFFYITGAFVTQVAGHFLQYYGSSRRGYAFGETARRWLSAIAPWIILALLALSQTLIPIITGSSPRLTITTILLLALLTVFIQVGRKTAHRGQAQQPSTTQHQPGRIQRGWIQLCLILFSYGIPRTHQAVENLHFTVASGMIGVLGPNGAGKTTLLRLLANILVPTRGTIYYAGKEKRQWQELSSMIGYLPQEFGLPGHLTVRAYLEYYALLYRINNPQERKQRIDTLLQEVGMQGSDEKKISSLSGGMCQRVAIARTLLHQPPIIIVDEPTIGLDPKERIRFRNLLTKMAKTRIVIYSTHIIEDVAVACDTVLVINHGRLVYNGDPETLASLSAENVWELVLPADIPAKFDHPVKIIEQVPQTQDSMRYRLLCHSRPHSLAQPCSPRLEDGYIHLLHRNSPT